MISPLILHITAMETPFKRTRVEPFRNFTHLLAKALILQVRHSDKRPVFVTGFSRVAALVFAVGEACKHGKA